MVDGISFASILLAIGSRIKFALLAFLDWYSLDKRLDHFWNLGQLDGLDLALVAQCGHSRINWQLRPRAAHPP